MMGRVAVRDMETAELLNLEPGVQKLKIMSVVLVSVVEVHNSIILQWPYMIEQIGRNFDGWLASITDCLKSTRRHLGMID